MRKSQTVRARRSEGAAPTPCTVFRDLRRSGLPTMTVSLVLNPVVMGEIAALTRRAEGTLRWMRHMCKIEPLFNSHGRLFAWKSELVAWLDQEQANDVATRFSP
ncbi:hypothetical protein SAMN05216276_108617 [Streptosporangium subroseum]|uniref:Uncharacterized protein n=1 Tax=Streptosporangium subroseum TaxID=106412 RepID=A0A239P4M7_9ACTN|nr:hypothetical protein SAMN05216276_108617 [Streptosporangium subroseum]